MKKDKHITPVSFWIEPTQEIINDQDFREYYDKDVLAYFPNIPAKRGHCVVYAHVGQHQECPTDYIDECKPATIEQYTVLYEELQSMGYNLQVI